MSKFERQGAILRLVQQRKLSTQAEVAAALREEGYDAVQTTVSRDIAQLGLVKVRDDEGRLVYALPGAADLQRMSELTSALRRWAVSLAVSANLVVIQTPPGCANALCQVIDDAHLADVAGTVAGDNTIFLAALPAVAEVRGRGLLLGAELDRPAAGVVEACRDRGLLVGSAGESVLRLTPPLTISTAALAHALGVLEEVLS